MSTARAYIQINGLVKTYGNRQVVDGVDLSVRAGGIVGLLGPNGAGKTTTFYIIVGLVPATRGLCILINSILHEFPCTKEPV